MNRTSDTVAGHPVATVADQLTLPFLTDDQAATIDAAREAVDRATANAVAARRTVEAAELARLGGQLAELLEANAGGYRAAARR